MVSLFDTEKKKQFQQFEPLSKPVRMMKSLYNNDYIKWKWKWNELWHHAVYHSIICHPKERKKKWNLCEAAHGGFHGASITNDHEKWICSNLINFNDTLSFSCLFVRSFPPGFCSVLLIYSRWLCVSSVNNLDVIHPKNNFSTIYAFTFSSSRQCNYSLQAFFALWFCCCCYFLF